MILLGLLTVAMVDSPRRNAFIVPDELRSWREVSLPEMVYICYAVWTAHDYSALARVIRLSVRWHRKTAAPRRTTLSAAVLGAQKRTPLCQQLSRPSTMVACLPSSEEKSGVVE